MFKQYPVVSSSDMKEIEKLDVILEQLKKEGHGSWSKFVIRAIIEKYDRMVMEKKNLDSGVFSPLQTLMQSVNDYYAFHRYGISFRNMFNRNAVSFEDLDKFHSSLKFIEKAVLSPEIEEENYRRIKGKHK